MKILMTGHKGQVGQAALDDNGFEELRVEHYDVRGTPATWVAARSV